MGVGTKFNGDLRCTGAFTADGGMQGDVTGNLTGNVNGNVKGAISGAVTVAKADDYALTAAQKASVYISVEMTAAGKTLTLGLAQGQLAFVHNAGATNAFTLKNLAGDTGASLAAGKIALVVGSNSAATTVIQVLN